jgi:hypothetical protein
MKICPVREELFHAYRRKDTKLIVAFRKFAKASKYVKKRKALCTQFRHTGNWKHNSTHSLPRHQINVSGQIHALATLTAGKKAPHSLLSTRLCGSEGESRKFREEINLLHKPGVKPQFLGLPAPIIATILTELSQPPK